MATLRTVTKNTLLYTFSTVLQRASSIIFFPIFSYYLTKGDYGIQSIVSFITQFAMIFCSMELGRTATRFIHEGEDTEALAKKIYGPYVIAMFGVNVLVGILILLIGPWVLKPFLNDIPFSPYIVLTVCTLPFVAVYTLFKNYLQSTHQGVRFVKIDFMYFVSNVGLNLLFVVGFGMGADGIILSTVVSAAVFSVFAYFSFFRHTNMSFDSSILKEGLRFSLPFVPFMLIGVLLEGTDKMILNAKLGKDAAGILYIATMIAAMFTVLRESSYQALIPWFYQQYDKLSKKYVDRVLYVLFGGMAVLCICVSLFTFEILTLLSSNDDLVEAYRYAPIIVNTGLVVFLGQIFNLTTMYFKKQSRYLFLTTLIAVPVNAGLSLLLIDRLGIYGATASNFAAMSVMTIVCGILSRKSGFRIQYGYFIAMIICSMAISMLVLTPLPFWTLLIVKVIVAMILCSSFYILAARYFPINELVMSRINPMLAFVQRVRG